MSALWPALWGTDNRRNPFSVLRREMDRMLDDFGNGIWPTPQETTDSPLASVPRVDVKDLAHAVQVVADLPGLTKEDIHLTLVDGVLSISGEHKEEKEEKMDDYYLQERRYGSFYRSLVLPCAVQESRVEATFKNGQLTVTIPKDEKQTRKAALITINDA